MGDVAVANAENAACVGMSFDRGDIAEDGVRIAGEVNMVYQVDVAHCAAERPAAPGVALEDERSSLKEALKAPFYPTDSGGCQHVEVGIGVRRRKIDAPDGI